MKVHELLEGTLPRSLGISASTLKELRKWRQNKRSGKYDLSAEAIAELQKNPALRKTGTTKVYRGLNFTAKQLKKNPELLKLIETESKGEATITWPKPSSWTTDRTMATSFARHGTAKYGDGAHSGEFGVLVSFDVPSKDIILDMNLFDGYTHEDEVILASGTFKVQVLKIFKDDTGHSLDVENELQDIKNQLANFKPDKKYDPKYLELEKYKLRETIQFWQRRFKQYDKKVIAQSPSLKKFVDALLSTPTTEIEYGKYDPVEAAAQEKLFDLVRTVKF